MNDWELRLREAEAAVASRDAVIARIKYYCELKNMKMDDADPDTILEMIAAIAPTSSSGEAGA
ncbi:hypothetical protein BH09PSE6_BH09PSE6_17860 [soil metagenome]